MPEKRMYLYNQIYLIMKNEILNKKINAILNIEQLEERLEMNTLAALDSYCSNGNSTTTTVGK